MDPVRILFALALGLVARRVGLPPMIGFLGGGFLLHALGQEMGDVLPRVAHLGVTMLLFTIGCKLDLRSLIRREIWGTAPIHMMATVVIFGAALFLLGVLGLPKFTDLDFTLSILVAFALSFSSTVFAVKVLEERGEMGARHGQIAIGILVMQDLVAVLFLAISMGKVPSPWAACLLGLPLLRPLLLRLLTLAGHGELLILSGIVLTWAASSGFEALGLKGDLGALIAGVLVSSHPKGEEVAKSLFAFKDAFLVGFFLSIGFQGTPDLGGLLIALVLVVAVPLKVALFFGLMTRFRQRSRTALLTSFSLANYSEFGLIVAALAVSKGWMSPDWLVIIAIAVAISFITASPLNVAAVAIYSRLERYLRRFQRPDAAEPVDLGGAEILIFGLGGVGTGAFDTMRQRCGDAALGVDACPEVVARHRGAGRPAIVGDPTDVEFLEMMPLGELKLIMLVMTPHSANVCAADFLRGRGYAGPIAAVAGYPDEIAELEAHGVTAFDLSSEAGAGFAAHACAGVNLPTDAD